MKPYNVSIEAPYEREILRLQKEVEEKDKQIERLMGLLEHEFKTAHLASLLIDGYMPGQTGELVKKAWEEYKNNF